MASVTSLDQDMRNLRMSRYTPAAANEVRAWIESSLGRTLASGDLLDALKDGVALCELVNLVLPASTIKYKSSSMPFVQMENISHFLRACEMPPLSMPAHDRFLTVDLYESKDPAQVMQCLAAFSRQAHALNPARFSSAIGPKKSGVITPNTTGRPTASTSPTRPPNMNRMSATMSPPSGLPSSTARAMSPSVTGGSTGSQNSTTRSPAPVSSWSNKSDVGTTAPAWSIHQYGWTGGADQGKQGISFGARRQITSQAPHVPSLAEKERARKEKAAEAERERRQQEEEAESKRLDSEREKRMAQEAEEIRWQQETQRHRDEERARLAQQKQEWEAQERQWREAEERRKQEEASVIAQTAKKPPEKPRTPSGNILRGQTLSQYQREQSSIKTEPSETADQVRVRELERQLAEARERERQYQTEREERIQQHKAAPEEASTTERPQTAQSEGDLSWTADDREYQRKQLRAETSKLSQSSIASADGGDRDTQHRGYERQTLTENIAAAELPSRMLPQEPKSTTSARPNTPESATVTTPTHQPPVTSSIGRGSTIRSPFTRPANRTENFLTSNPAPIAASPRISASTEAGDTAQEQAKLRDDRIASQQKTRAGAWASKSLLEREMERERERQREWEANQSAVKDAPRDATQGTGEGQTWDVNTYGWIKGDSQNRGSSSGSGINVGGRRQIIGPRPQPG